MRDVPPGPPPASGPPPAPGTSDAADAARTAPGDGRTGVVVITRDRRERLLHTLERLTALPERPPVVVVDNASSDGTARAVRERFPQVRLLTPGRNLGAVGRNLGARALSTPYAAFSDDDSWWEPGALARAADLLDAHARLALVAAATRVGAEGLPDPLNEVLAASPLGTAPDLPGPSVLGFLACACVVRREAFLGVGGFHPVLHFGAEETLLAVDLSAGGWGVVHVPRVVARHDPDPAPREGRPARVLRNELLTAWMRRPLHRALTRTAGLVRQARTDPQARRARAGAARRLPAALAARRPVPARVEHRIRLLETASRPGPGRGAEGAPTAGGGPPRTPEDRSDR
ncbi:glycosyltransferase family 2 protein [Streptomyces sp. NPDC059506]|uniref:glycosyltransferase family 2 protein n=1 Tax=Streptomyces sp. NPDC059506 TaxID=3347751 RepID=UPI00367A2E75